MRGVSSGLLLLVVAGCAATLALAGCGGSESHLTKGQFLRQGDAICKQAATEQVRLASGHSNSAVASWEWKTVTAVFVAPMEKELRRLRALNPPQADKKKIREILIGTEIGIKDARGDYLDIFYKETDPFRRADELAGRYGFNACAESSHAVIKPRVRVIPKRFE